mgnify:CR=1 FL=1
MEYKEISLKNDVHHQSNEYNIMLPLAPPAPNSQEIFDWSAENGIDVKTSDERAGGEGESLVLRFKNARDVLTFQQQFLATDEWYQLYDQIELCIILDYLEIERFDALRNVVFELVEDEDQAVVSGGYIRPLISSMGGYGAAIDNAVARLVLNAIPNRMPDQVTRRCDGMIIRGEDMQAPEAMPLPPIPSYLFGINWACTGPGMDWREHYHLGYLPGFDVFVVTASQDSTEVLGYLETAIGWFPASGSLELGISAVIYEWWSWHASHSNERWEAITSKGLISAKTAADLADTIWGNGQQEL